MENGSPLIRLDSMLNCIWHFEWQKKDLTGKSWRQYNMAGFNTLVSEIIYEPLQIKNKSSNRAFFMEACDEFKMLSDTSEWQKRSRCIFKTSVMS